MTKKKEEMAPHKLPDSPPPHAIAFILDDVVEEVIYTQDRLAALLQSEPIIVNATGVTPRIGQTTYNPETGEFTNPDGTIQKATPLPFSSEEE